MNQTYDANRHNGLAELFPTPGNHAEKEPISFQDVGGYISRIAVEYLHEVRPDLIIFGDRGARLFAFAIWLSWRHRFPDEPFPTKDGKMHVARVTSRSATKEHVTRSVHNTLARAGYTPNDKTFKTNPPNVVYLDDWSVFGKTASRFIDAAEQFGVPRSALTYLTMCGRTTTAMRHLVCDPSRDPALSSWENRGDYAGVSYNTPDHITPQVQRSPLVRVARDIIATNIAQYYARYDAALAAGRIAACACTSDGHLDNA